MLVAQSCPALCNPVDCCPSDSSVHGILQARILSELPFPSPGDLPNPGIKPESLVSPAVQMDSLPAEPSGKLLKWVFSLAQLLSRIWLFVIPWTAARQASLSITNSWSLLKLMSIESVMPSNLLILCHPLLLLPSIFPSSRVFSNESAVPIRWPKYESFSFSISPSNEYSGLISLGIDWIDLAVQRTLKSLLQHYSSKASILLCSAFFIVQLSHPYMITGKTIALTIQTFVGKIMTLLFNMLSRLVITFFPRSKRLLISWLQSLSTMILETKKIKSVTVFPFCLPSSDGTRCHDLQFLNVWF